MKLLRIVMLAARDFTVLFLLWIILSWEFSWFLLSLGLVSSIVLALIHGVLPYQNIRIHFKLKPLLLYTPWLMWQVALSAIYVTKKIWSIKMDITTTKENFLTIDNKQKNNIISAIFAHSVTLTPGTATLLFEDNKYYIHCLTQEVKQGVFDIEEKLSNK